MTILKSIINKIKNFSTETKFNINLKKFIKSKEEDIIEAEACFEEAIIKGDASDAYYAWRRINSYKEDLQDRLNFEKYMLSSVA